MNNNGKEERLYEQVWMTLVFNFKLYNNDLERRTQGVLKGHWTSVTSSPNFFSKKWEFYIIGSVGMDNDCMLSFTF